MRRRPLARFLFASTLLVLGFAGGLSSCGDGEPSAPVDPDDDLGSPRILAFVPSIVTPGQTVLILGANFGSDATRVRVTFDEVPGRVVSVSDSSVVAVVPLGIDRGQVIVRVILLGFSAVGTALLTIVPPGIDFASVSVGSGFTCGIREHLGAFCWGSGLRGQLGNGAPLNHAPTPLPVVSGADFRAVSAGNRHACTLDGAGRAYCWGLNGAGQLGNGTRTDSSVPVPVSGDLVFESLSVGLFHVCGVATGGTAYCWGSNNFGQLGTVVAEGSPVPVPVAGALVFESLSTGGFHTCGITTGSQTFCWGRNTHGQLGDGTTATGSTPEPMAVAGGLTFSQVSAGRGLPALRRAIGEHTCALTPGGAAYCWGYNFDGQLGNDSRTGSLEPVAVSAGLSLATISAGAFYTCALTTLGEALCWGANDAGQVGSGSSALRVSSPARVLGGLEFVSISAGGASKSAVGAARSHTCGITRERKAYCWGRNDSGQLGSGFTSTESTPVPVVEQPEGESPVPPREGRAG